MTVKIQTYNNYKVAKLLQCYIRDITFNQDYYKVGMVSNSKTHSAPLRGCFLPMQPLSLLQISFVVEVEELFSIFGKNIFFKKILTIDSILT